jgi:hypothetical protein
MAKGKKKPTAKKAKVKRRLRYPPLSPEEEAQWAQYWNNLPQITAEDRAFLDRALGREMFGRAASPPPPPQPQPAPAPVAAPPPTKHHRRPSQELCWRVFDRLFHDNPMPDEVELSTVDLQGMVEADLKREAAKVGTKPPATPSLPTVTSARRNWSR